jgi:hypothetical protein
MFIKTFILICLFFFICIENVGGQDLFGGLLGGQSGQNPLGSLLGGQQGGQAAGNPLGSLLGGQQGGQSGGNPM